MLALCCSRLVANSCPSTWAPAIVSVPSAGSLCSALQQHERVVSGQAQQASSSQQPTRNDQKPSCSQEHAACSWNSERCISQSNSADLSIRNNLACTTQGAWGTPLQQPPLTQQPFQGWGLRQSSLASSSTPSTSSSCTSMGQAGSLQQLRHYKSLKKSMKPLNTRASRMAVQPYLPPPTEKEMKERMKFKMAPVIDSAIPAIPEPPKPAVYRRVGQITAEYSLDLQPVFGVVEIAGRQFKVTPDDIIFVNHLADVAVNEVLALDRVMLLGTRETTVIGRPYVPNAHVLVAVEEHFKDGKVHVFKFKKRNRYRKYSAPREAMTALRILQVQGVPGAESAQVAGAQALPIKFYKGKGNSTSKDEVQQLTAKAA